METLDLFQEDASLPAQYWETFARKRDLEPEKRLLLAVLDEAIRCYRSQIFIGGRRFTEVESWLFSEDIDDTFSFRNICDVLNLSPSRIRQSLRTWKPSPVRQPTHRVRRPARLHVGYNGTALLAHRGV
ncbi:MAG TPA: hypothetical protein VI231_08990 [Candidatus Binatia bacterium]|jgi:hypothetical protein